MTLARSEREWTILVNEFNICKKKLNSKREALKILTSDLELCQRERDIYKTKIKQLLKEVEDYKRKEKEEQAQKSNQSTPVKKRLSFSGQSVWEQELRHVRERKQKTLSQLLCESRGENKALKKDFADLRQLYNDAQEDIQLLRETLANQRKSNNNIKDCKDGMDPRQDLICQLEKSQEKIMELERDKLATSDEKAEVATERDHFKDKSERLNTQLNFILGADDRRLVDIDSVLMENRYLKEQIKQLKEEKNMAVSALNRYKNTFEKRKNKIMQAQIQGSYTNTAKHAVPSLLSDLVGHLSSSTSVSTVADLQFLANSLSETLSEKDTALQHLRSANKILGHRVAELEKKLKTLEVSGLWSLQGHRGYGSTEADKLSCNRIQSLIPDEERRSNGHNNQHDDLEDAGKVSEPDSPSSPRWDPRPRSPILDLRPFQSDVEEGMLVNVAGSPGDGLEGIDYLEFVEEEDDDGDEEVEDFQPEELSCEELPESEQHEDKGCREDELRDSESSNNMLGEPHCINNMEISHEGDDSVRSLSLESNNHRSQRQNEDSDPDQKSVSDAELANLLKTL
ncbi:coiled-coil domain-containing protein 149-like [Pocillopora verrucosa]|uniref:coiled-coil domain-containing protein 149-like n=1 Tax=Pocillopora verrucosa TaxID=203993 RepID=UPI00334298F5